MTTIYYVNDLGMGRAVDLVTVKMDRDILDAQMFKILPCLALAKKAGILLRTHVQYILTIASPCIDSLIVFQELAVGVSAIGLCSYFVLF